MRSAYVLSADRIPNMPNQDMGAPPVSLTTTVPPYGDINAVYMDPLDLEPTPLLLRLSLYHLASLDDVRLGSLNCRTTAFKGLPRQARDYILCGFKEYRTKPVVAYLGMYSRQIVEMSGEERLLSFGILGLPTGPICQHEALSISLSC